MTLFKKFYLPILLASLSLPIQLTPVNAEGVSPKWVTAMKNGDNASQQKQWERALRFYDQALELMDDPQMTPQAPTADEVNRVLKRRDQAQILANEFSTSTRGVQTDCATMMRSQVRGIQITQHLIPVQFDFGKTTFTKKGQDTAQQLADCLKQQTTASQIKLVGHTDSKGSDELNDRLSLQHAERLRKFLQTVGVMAVIATEGRGKREPLPLDNPENYTSTEIDAMNRRVEVITE